MSSRLPETELANWAFLSPAQKRVNLERHEQPKLIVGSYEPFRKVFPDAVNQQFPLFSDALAATDWNALEARLVQECGGNEDKIRMNRRVLAATHKYAEEQRIAARGVDVLPLGFGGGIKYGFGLNLLIRYPTHSAIVFCDLRSSNRLADRAMRFVFSALHHRFREAYSDLAGAELEIWRYGTKTNRELTTVRFSGEALDWQTMVDDVLETHRIWDSVRKGGDDRKRAAGGGSGPLFDR